MKIVVRNNRKRIFLFHLVSPVFIIAVAIMLFTLPITSFSINIYLSLLLFNIIFNLIILQKSFNDLILENNNLIVEKGFFNKKTFEIDLRNYSKIEYHKQDIPGLMALNSLFFLKPNFERTTQRIYHSFIDDLDFEDLINEISRRLRQEK